MVILQCIQLIGHIVHSVGEVADLVIGVDGNLMRKVALGVGLCHGCNLVQRSIYGVCEEKQNDKCTQEYNCNGKKRDIHKAIDHGTGNAGNRLMYQHVALHTIVGGHWGKDRQYILGVAGIEIPDHIISASEIRCVKIRQDFVFRILRLLPHLRVGRVKKHTLLIVNDPDISIQIGPQRFHLSLKILERQGGVGVAFSVPGGNQRRFPVELLCLASFQKRDDGVLSKRKQYHEGQNAVDQVTQQKFDIKGTFHSDTSNLYPMPQTVAMDQESWSLIFSRSRLTWTSTVRVSPIYSYPQMWSRSCSLVNT